RPRAPQVQPPVALMAEAEPAPQRPAPMVEELAARSVVVAPRVALLAQPLSPPGLVNQHAASTESWVRHSRPGSPTVAADSAVPQAPAPLVLLPTALAARGVRQSLWEQLRPALASV